MGLLHTENVLSISGPVLVGLVVLWSHIYRCLVLNGLNGTVIYLCIASMLAYRLVILYPLYLRGIKINSTSKNL